MVGVNLRRHDLLGWRLQLLGGSQGLDGFDVIETVAAQTWADRVGGRSTLLPGISQFFVAADAATALAAITPQSVIGDTYRSTSIRGGILNGGFASRPGG